MTEEESAAYAEFQKAESEWRARRKSEYDAFLVAREGRRAQLVTLEQKRELLTQQESTLARQFALHKRMLSMMQSKDATKEEQGRKMKEILGAQTRITELKREMKSLVSKLSEGLE